MEGWEFAAPADAWERKTWAGIRHDDKSRRMLRLARDPNATSSDLQTIASDALQVVNNPWNTTGFQAVIEAVAAHPNTPPPLFGSLITRSPFACRAFCANPVAPFLLLENPAFVADLSDAAQNALLNQADAPPEMVRLLAVSDAAHRGTPYKDLQGTACLHIAFAGEASERAEWETQARDFYRTAAVNTEDAHEREWLADLIEIGMLPSWANGGRPFDEPTPPARLSAHPDVNRWLRFEHAPDSKEETYLLRGFLLSLEFVPLLPRLAYDLRASASGADLRRTLRAAQRPPLKHRAYRDEVKEIILRHPAADAALIEEVSKTWYQPEILVTLPQTPPLMVRDLLRNHSPVIRRLARRHPNCPPDAHELSRQTVLRLNAHHGTHRSYPSHPLAAIAAALHNEVERKDVPAKGDAPWWEMRLEAALIAPLNHVPLPHDEAKRTGRDLLNHLTHDGNRIVRAAAKTRLADADYRFIL